MGQYWPLYGAKNISLFVKHIVILITPPQLSGVTITRIVGHVELPILKINTQLRKDFIRALVRKFVTLVLLPPLIDVL